jgi:hypothetical protein
MFGCHDYEKREEIGMKNARVLSGLIILLVLVFFNVPSFAQSVLKVGTFNPRTGPAAAWGLNNDRVDSRGR